MKKKISAVAIGVLIAAFSATTHAGEKTNGNGVGNGNGSATSASGNGVSSNQVPPPACSTDSFHITAAGVSGTPQANLGAIKATSCLGVYSEPNNVGSLNAAQPNLGYLNSGLLNGEGGWISPTAFIDASRLQDLKTAGSFVDPGWIQLGTMHSNSGSLTAADVTPVGGSAFNLSQVFTYTQTVVPGASSLTGGIGGTWTLAVNPDVVEILHRNGLFERNNFDQLAFEVKAGSNWAVYNFDFITYEGFDLTKPYTISGTWDLNDFRNPTDNADQNISLLSVWARDPSTPESANVPEPGTMALFGAGVAVLAGLGRRRQRKQASIR